MDNNTLKEQLSTETTVFKKSVTVSQNTFMKEAIKAGNNFSTFKKLGGRVFMFFEKQILSKRDKMVVETIKEYIKDDDLVRACLIRANNESLNKYTDHIFDKAIYSYFKYKYNNDNGAFFLVECLKNNIFLDVKYFANFCMSDAGHKILLNSIYKNNNNTYFNQEIEILKEDKNSLDIINKEQVNYTNNPIGLDCCRRYPTLSLYIDKLLEDPNIGAQLYIEWKKSLDNCYKQSPRQYLEGKDKNNKCRSEDYLVLDRTSKSIIEAHIIYNQAIKYCELKEVLDKLEGIKQKTDTYVAQNMEDIYQKVEDNSQSQPFRRLLNYNKIFENILIKERLHEDNLPQVDLSGLELPEEVKEIILNIFKDHKIIEKYNSVLTDSQKHDVENIMEKRLVETVDKYFSIEMQYRNTIKNIEGRTAKELLILSLENIKDILNSVIENVNSDKISSLSVTQRYLKELKSQYSTELQEDNNTIKLKVK